MWFSPKTMHIPDGFLSVLVSIFFWIISVLIVYIAIRQVSKEQDDRKLPIMGVLAAAIFAGQMLNFAIAGGTSGHLLGATLATIIVGPWAAILVMTCVVAVQAIIFQDGGLLAMGANIFNMAIIGVMVSFLLYSTFTKISRGKRWGIFIGASMAAWSTILIASLSAAMQLAISGTSPANIAIPAMAGIHAFIGIGETLITLGAVAFLIVTRPDLLTFNSKTIHGRTGLWVGGLALAVLLASPVTYGHPHIRMDWNGSLSSRISSNWHNQQHFN